jgi:hypothetical protein
MVRAWHGRGMARVNQTRPHCVNQMGKTHSKPLAARHGRRTAWARYAMCESVLKVTRSTPVQTQRRGRGIPQTRSSPRREKRVVCTASRPFCPRERKLVSTVQGGWVGIGTGQDGCGKSRPITNSRSLDHPKLSDSLYRLSYPGPLNNIEYQ